MDKILRAVLNLYKQTVSRQYSIFQVSHVYIILVNCDDVVISKQN